MLIYRDIDGVKFRGATADEVVRDMHQQSFSAAKDDTLFMQQSAARASAMIGRPIRSNTADNYLADLVEAGLLSKDTES
jgi:hypothetical protein